MTLQEFKEKTKELETLEKKILDLKFFLKGLYYGPEYIIVKYYTNKDNSEREYSFYYERIIKMSEDNLKDYIQGYESKIKELKENGLNITPNPKIIKED